MRKRSQFAISSHFLVVRILVDPRSRLQFFLWCAAVQSLVVGFVLLSQPYFLAKFLGVASSVGYFFWAQGGVFHIILSFLYHIAARDLDEQGSMVIFSIIVKVVATIFLLVYFFFVDSILLALFAGIGEGLLGAMILFSYLSYRKIYGIT
ncbi:MAG: hypothetical protein KAI35_07000 [Desulfobulbaceae bacterium]|nr:hypothetical protein [Desulfobulbaceae bacterium]